MAKRLFESVNLGSHCGGARGRGCIPGSHTPLRTWLPAVISSCAASRVGICGDEWRANACSCLRRAGTLPASSPDSSPRVGIRRLDERSEEHTSELQSLRHLVCRLLLEK